jgi:hypothetical protein
MHAHPRQVGPVFHADCELGVSLFQLGVAFLSIMSIVFFFCTACGHRFDGYLRSFLSFHNWNQVRLEETQHNVHHVNTHVPDDIKKRKETQFAEAIDTIFPTWVLVLGS